jgi:hypothetical protein
MVKGKRRDAGLLRANLTKKARRCNLLHFHLLFWGLSPLIRPLPGSAAAANPIAHHLQHGSDAATFPSAFREASGSATNTAVSLVCHVCCGSPRRRCLHQGAAQNRGTSLLDFKPSRNAWTSVRSLANSTRISFMHTSLAASVESVYTTSGPRKRLATLLGN